MDGILFPLVLSLHILVGLSLIGLILLQHGKGADMGAAFGSGASGSLFGASGSANFLSRTTAVLATVFFLTSLSLSYIVSTRTSVAPKSVMDTVKTESLPAAPAKPAAPVPAPVDANSKSKEIPK
jgi:preprotein translocase subunit SecG